MKTWPDKTPKSTGNAFDRSLAKPSGFDTGAEKAKAARLAAADVSTDTCQSFAPMPGLSVKAQKALRVPKNRTTVALTGSACLSRIPDIPKAKRSNA